jgi:hypothetical protein
MTRFFRSGLCSSPRGGPPLPTSHEHQRAARASGQSTTYSQGVYNGQPRDTTSTTAFNQMRSPPIAAWAIPSQIYHATSPLHHAISPDDSMDSESPPAPIDGVSLIRQTTPLQDRPRSQSLLLQHRANPMNSGLDSTRPRFRSLGPHLTPDLVAEIERVHPRGPGMSGVAYAGSPLSGPVSGSTQLMFSPESLPKQSTLEIIRGGKRSCPGELEERPTGVPRCNTTPPDQDRETWEHHRRGSGERDPPQIIPAQQPSPKLELQRANSPKYIPSLSDHSEHSASHNPGDRELRSTQAAPLPPNPPVSRQNVPRTEQPRSTQPAVAKLATQSPNGQSVKARFPDKSLPVQEDSDKDDEDEQDDNPERRERDRSIPGGGEDGWLAHNGHDQVVSDPGREHFDASSPTSSLDLVATYYYNNDPHHSHSRSGAPISHTPRSHTTTTSPSPSPLIAGTSLSNVTKPVLPPCSPSPRVDLRHKSYAVWDNGTVRLSKMDPNVVRERRVLQLQADTLDNGVSDSMVSQSSTPFPGTQCNPPTSLQNKPSRGRCGEIEDSQASTHSSPSHQSAPLAPLSRRHRGRRRCERSQDLRRLPQRVESAPPRVSCPEMSSSEETARKSKAGEHQSKPQSVHQPARKGESADDGDEAHVDDGEWIDVDVGAESIADNLLQLESHSGYVSDPKKRRRRWEHHWEVLLNAVSAPASVALRSFTQV